MQYCNTCDGLIDEDKPCPYCAKLVPIEHNPLMIDSLDGAALNRARQTLGIGDKGYDDACGKDDDRCQLLHGIVKQTVGKVVLRLFTERCQIMRN